MLKQVPERIEATDEGSKTVALSPGTEVRIQLSPTAITPLRTGVSSLYGRRDAQEAPPVAAPCADQ